MIYNALLLLLASILLSVWLLRFNRDTPYRGGGAKNMKEEFAAYGLPGWAMYAVGALKVCAAITLIVGLWIPSLIPPVAALIGVLMISALAMHIKIKDPMKKSMPALFVLVLSVVLIVL